MLYGLRKKKCKMIVCWNGNVGVLFYMWLLLKFFFRRWYLKREWMEVSYVDDKGGCLFWVEGVVYVNIIVIVVGVYLVCFRNFCEVSRVEVKWVWGRMVGCKIRMVEEV